MPGANSREIERVWILEDRQDTPHKNGVSLFCWGGVRSDHEDSRKEKIEGKANLMRRIKRWGGRNINHKKVGGPIASLERWACELVIQIEGLLNAGRSIDEITWHKI